MRTTPTLLLGTLLCALQATAQKDERTLSNWIFTYNQETSSSVRLHNWDGDLLVSHVPVTVPNANQINFQLAEMALQSPWGTGGTSRTFYQTFFGQQNCTGMQNQLNNCSGISGIEVDNTLPVQSPWPTTDLALAGAAREGVWFALRNRMAFYAAFPVQVMYPFPAIAATQPSKPLLLQNRQQHEYFITGEYNGRIYVMLVNQSGATIWNMIYARPQTTITPRGMILDPFQPMTLVIAGEARMPGGTSDGFLLKLDINTGLTTGFSTYDANNSNDGFSSIEPCLGPQPASYVLGGYTSLGQQRMPWFVKLDAIGNPLVSKCVFSSTDSQARGLLSVVERINPFTPRIEYYGVFDSNQDLIVGKFDQMGDPIHLSSPLENSEFPYSPGPGMTEIPVGLTIDNGTLSGPQTGISVFGSVHSGTTHDFHFVRAFFNGITGCSTPIQQPMPLPSPIIRTNRSITLWGALAPCSNFNIVCFGNTPAAWGCSGNLTSGSNMRTSSATTGPTNENDLHNVRPQFSFYPNPVSDVLEISYETLSELTVHISVSDALGKLIHHRNYDAGNTSAQKFLLNLRELDLQGGIYFITIRNGHQTITEKILYQ